MPLDDRPASFPSGRLISVPARARITIAAVPLPTSLLARSTWKDESASMRLRPTWEGRSPGRPASRSDAPKNVALRALLSVGDLEIAAPRSAICSGVQRWGKDQVTDLLFTHKSLRQHRCAMRVGVEVAAVTRWEGRLPSRPAPRSGAPQQGRFAPRALSVGDWEVAAPRGAARISDEPGQVGGQLGLETVLLAADRMRNPQRP